MEPRISVLVYSKYSTGCKAFFDYIGNNAIAIPNFDTLCIDNAEVRKRIQQDKTFGITTVPCLLSLYDDGNVEKYDGDALYRLADTHAVIPEPSPPPPPTQVVPPVQTAPHTVGKTGVGKTGLGTPERKAEQDRQDLVREQMERAPRPKKKVEASVKRTSLEEDDSNEPQQDSEEEEPDDRTISRRPPARVRNGEGEYLEDDTMFQDDPPDVRTTDRKSVRNRPGSRDKPAEEQGSMVFNKAKQMQQERDSIESSFGGGKRRKD